MKRLPTKSDNDKAKKGDPIGTRTVLESSGCIRHGSENHLGDVPVFGDLVTLKTEKMDLPQPAFAGFGFVHQHFGMRRYHVPVDKYMPDGEIRVRSLGRALLEGSYLCVAEGCHAAPCERVVRLAIGGEEMRPFLEPPVFYKAEICKNDVPAPRRIPHDRLYENSLVHVPPPF